MPVMNNSIFLEMKIKPRRLTILKLQLQQQEQKYLALLVESCTLSLKCFSSSVATGGAGFCWETPKEWSSDILPYGTPRTLLSSPERGYFWLPNVIRSRGKHWGRGGISDGKVTLPRPEVFPEPSISLPIPTSSCLNLYQWDPKSLTQHSSKKTA